MWLRTVFLLTLAQLALTSTHYSYNVLQMRTDNLEQLRKDHQMLHVLLHQPNCAHSQEYKLQFEQLAVNLKQSHSDIVLASVNCQEQQQVCQDFGVIGFPSLFKMEQNSIKQINEIKFLVENGYDVSEEKKQAAMAISWLYEPPKHFIAVLEEDGIEVPEEYRLHMDRLIYLQPSPLYHTLLNLTNYRTGCWIFQHTSESTLKRYSCGNGFYKAVVEDALKDFERGSLPYYIFKTEFALSGNKVDRYETMTYDDLYKYLKNGNKVDKVILYDGYSCPFSQGVSTGISEALKNLDPSDRRLPKKFSRYDLDHNILPEGKVIGRLPTLEFWCKGEKYDYEGRTDGIAFGKFLKTTVEYCYKKDYLRKAEQKKRNEKPSASESAETKQGEVEAEL